MLKENPPLCGGFFCGYSPHPVRFIPRSGRSAPARFAIVASVGAKARSYRSFAYLPGLP